MDDTGSGYPPFKPNFYICGPFPAEYGQQPDGGQTVAIPKGKRDFTVPAIKIRADPLKP